MRVVRRRHSRISTDARAYRIDIYRLGCYGGAGARQVAGISPSGSLLQNQPACPSDTSTGLVDCGNWSVFPSWAIPVAAVSGVYVAKLTRTDTGGSSHIRLIVRDEASHSDRFVPTSDTTWQAYSTYGGNSFCVGQPAGRAYKVSLQPPAVWPGQSVSRRLCERVSDDPLTRGPTATTLPTPRGQLLQARQTPSKITRRSSPSVTTNTGRASSEPTRSGPQGGVSLAFFSGNSICWKMRCESSIRASTKANRTLVFYKESWANSKIDPSPEWTDTWCDQRFGPLPRGVRSA
jgi:hypothetical protein